ncbi:CehA/McbA family metallohydrolase [Phenylobacterium sp.]|jgi:hypothetical protein|uniref:CehA/McbA family metallohydrolase n=1 Tax=Phenylobacterium sp. TaxID=1871053 RepID=UPI002F930479
MTHADHQTYREVPFRVPPGVTRLTIQFAYTGREQRAVIDLGLRDPQRFRGWSGGNKSRFTISEAEATPSYLPGPLPSGEWKLVLGVPSVREGVRAEYTARIWFERDMRFAGFAEGPLKTGPAWYRGDLHMHTAHSDGSCPSASGKKVPCPVYRTVEAASARGLDFIAVTDHNATSQNAALRELQPAFDKLLLIPGREVTTFQGHANVFGPSAFLDFQLTSKRAPTMAVVQRQVARAGGVFSVNHPGQPSGAACMGCGWTSKDTDYAAVQAVEAVNGSSIGQYGGAEGPTSGIPFWEARLSEGFRITAIGGSDNHDPTIAPLNTNAIGLPTTVVRAENLSQEAILAGIRAGRVFVDVTGSRDKLLEVTAQAAGRSAEMGGALEAAAGAAVRLSARVVGAAGGTARVAWNGPALGAAGEQRLSGADQTVAFQLAGDGRPRWLRVDVRGPDGSLWLLGNPIFLNPAAPSP